MDGGRREASESRSGLRRGRPRTVGAGADSGGSEDVRPWQAPGGQTQLADEAAEHLLGVGPGFRGEQSPVQAVLGDIGGEIGETPRVRPQQDFGVSAEVAREDGTRVPRREALPVVERGQGCGRCRARRGSAPGPPRANTRRRAIDPRRSAEGRIRSRAPRPGKNGEDEGDAAQGRGRGLRDARTDGAGEAVPERAENRMGGDAPERGERRQQGKRDPGNLGREKSQRPDRTGTGGPWATGKKRQPKRRLQGKGSDGRIGREGKRATRQRRRRSGSARPNPGIAGVG